MTTDAKEICASKPAHIRCKTIFVILWPAQRRQKDEARIETESRISIDPLSKSLEEMAKGLESDG